MNGTLRVLVVTSDKYPPFRPAAKAIFGEEFAARGHRVDWVMPAEDPSSGSGKIPFHNGFVFLAKTNKAESRFGRALKHLWDALNDFRVIGLLRSGQYDIVQVKDKYFAAVITLWAARRARVPFCYWLAYPHAEADLYAAREGMARYPLYYRVRGWLRAKLLYGLLLPAADHIFVQSEQMQRDIAEHGIDGARMTPVPGSLNIEDVPYLDTSANEIDAETILYVGTLIRERHLDFLIRAFGKVRERKPEARLVIVGKGESPEDDELLNTEIRRLHLEDAVEFVGHVPLAEVWPYVRRAALCVSPYYPSWILNSTSPTKLIEYLAMAKAVVCNDHPEQNLVIAASGAGLCVPWDESAFAGAMLELIQDPHRCEAMGQSGRIWVANNRTNALMADAVLAVYRHLKAGIEAGAH